MLIPLSRHVACLKMGKTYFAKSTKSLITSVVVRIFDFALGRFSFELGNKPALTVTAIMVDYDGNISNFDF